MQVYAVMVILDDEEEFLCVGMTTRVARFSSRAAAQREADFLNEGLDDGDSATVVKMPSPKRLREDGYQ